MAYEHAVHHDWLRLALRQLEAEGISPGVILAELQREKKLSEKKPFIRQTFARFVHGNGKCRNKNGLIAIYEYLRSRPDYWDKVSIPLPQEAFGPLLGMFYSDHPGTTFPIGLATHAFPGQYNMYRPDFAGDKFKKGYFRFSELRIELRAGVLCVTEKQMMPGATPKEQTDEGVFLSHGGHGYVLLRGKNISCVKLMVIRTALPEIGPDVCVEWFAGVMFVASHAGIFPAARFFCRRLPPGSKLVTGSKKLIGLRDSEARAWLAFPVLDEPIR